LPRLFFFSALMLESRAVAVVAWPVAVVAVIVKVADSRTFFLVSALAADAGSLRVIVRGTPALTVVDVGDSVILRVLGLARRRLRPTDAPRPLRLNVSVI
jgi:hypothetical protein